MWSVFLQDVENVNLQVQTLMDRVAQFVSFETQLSTFRRDLFRLRPVRLSFRQAEVVKLYIMSQFLRKQQFVTGLSIFVWLLVPQRKFRVWGLTVQSAINSVF